MGSAKQAKTRTVTEFGDFQTPPALACAASEVLYQFGIRPRSIVEPTCGRGAFVFAAAAVFAEAEAVIGFDINPEHLQSARAAADIAGGRIRFEQGDFFKVDWGNIVKKDHGPWLIVGNPPWVMMQGSGLLKAKTYRKSRTSTGGEVSKRSQERATSIFRNGCCCGISIG